MCIICVNALSICTNSQHNGTMIILRIFIHIAYKMRHFQTPNLPNTTNKGDMG